MTAVVSTRLAAADAAKLKALARKRKVKLADLIRYFIVRELHRA